MDRRLSVNRRTKYVVIGLAVLCLAYPGFAWLIGLQVEASLAKREQQAMEQYPGSITLISRQYHRGVYGATEDLSYGLGGSAMRAFAPLATGSNIGAMHLIVHNTIHHGPLPQFRAIAMATINTQIQLPVEVSAKLRALLGNEPTIQIRGRLGWLGGMRTEIESASYQARLADGTEISWQGLKASSSVNRDLSSNSAEVTVASFGVKSDKVRVEADGLHIEADWKRAFDLLYTGPFAMKIATVKWQSLPGSGQVLVQGFSVKGSGAADGEYYKSAVDIGADAVQAPGYSVTHADYAVSIDHLHAPTLVAMMKDARAAQLPTTTTTDAVKKNGIELLLHEPVLNISRIGFAMPEGELRLSATASAPGLKREDFDGAPLQSALMQHLNVVADLRIDAALATRLLAGNRQKDALEAQIDAFVKQGYIKRDGAALTAHLTFGGGKLAVNGLPYPPNRAR
jgi:uncharacterized protein YdgA (DUF945 family)